MGTHRRDPQPNLRVGRAQEGFLRIVMLSEGCIGISQAKRGRARSMHKPSRQEALIWALRELQCSRKEKRKDRKGGRVQDEAREKATAPNLDLKEIGIQEATLRFAF